MRKIVLGSWLATLMVASSWAAAPATGETVLEMAGGTTPWSQAIAPRLMELKAAGVTVRYRGVGTGRGVLALMEGKVTVAAVGDTLADSVAAALQAAKAENREVAVPANLTYTRIGADEQVVVVHQSNPLHELSKAQLKAIATGRTSNWSQLGGADMPIQVVVTEPSLAPGQFFRKTIMDGEPYAANAIEVRSPREVIAVVARYPGGMGAAAAIHVKEAPGLTKVVKTPVIQRPLGLVTLGTPTGAAKTLADLLRQR